MTWLRRTLRNLTQRLRGSYYEGPEPPPRLAADARWFGALHPQATAAEWQAYAERAVASAYRDGFTRGLEWNERLWPGPSVDPEELATDLRAHGWLPPEPNVAPPPAMTHPAALTSLEEQRLRHQLAHVGAKLIPLEPVRRRRT